MSDLTPQQVAEMRKSGKIQLIDVRERYEHEAGRIAGDQFIPLSELSGAAGSLDPSQPVVFYCRTGSRSSMAAEAFAGAGFQAHNLVGGLQAWEAAGLPLEPDDGYIA
jgi:rhodanese-related sulfurtransferase